MVRKIRKSDKDWIEGYFKGLDSDKEKSLSESKAHLDFDLKMGEMFGKILQNQKNILAEIEAKHQLEIADLKDVIENQRLLIVGLRDRLENRMEKN